MLLPSLGIFRKNLPSYSAIYEQSVRLREAAEEHGPASTLHTCILTGDVEAGPDERPTQATWAS